MFFLRIFEQPSYLVTLVRQVIQDLKYFMMFYMIITFMLSLIMGVIGYQNYTNCEYQQVNPKDGSNLSKRDCGGKPWMRYYEDGIFKG